MVSLPPDTKELCELLNFKGVKYLLVGGVVVAHHGYLRTTGDADLLLECSTENAQNMCEALKDLSVGSLQLSYSCPIPKNLQFN